MATFDWTGRMGVHQTYHRNVLNKVVHGICIPLQLWGAVHLLSALLNPFFVVLLLSPLYMLCDVAAGVSFAALLVVLGFVARDAHFLWGPVLFVVANLVQTKLGHALEEECRDDTQKNIAEFKQTKNPVPLLLIFFYHWVELFFLFGYKPELKQEVDRAQRDHEKTFRGNQ